VTSILIIVETGLVLYIHMNKYQLTTPKFNALQLLFI